MTHLWRIYRQLYGRLVFYDALWRKSKNTYDARNRFYDAYM